MYYISVLHLLQLHVNLSVSFQYKEGKWNLSLVSDEDLKETDNAINIICLP